MSATPSYVTFPGGESPSGPPSVLSPRFEYMMYQGWVSVKDLNSWGAEGWELVTVVNTGSTAPRLTVYLKKAIPLAPLVGDPNGGWKRSRCRHNRYD